MTWRVSMDGVDDTIRRLALLPGIFSKARIRTLKSLGYNIRAEMAAEMKAYRADGIHPLSRWKKNRDGSWRRGTGGGRTWAQMARLVRYTVDPAGTAVSVDVRDPKRGKSDPWNIDNRLQTRARQREFGETIRVTPAMRRKMAATRGRARVRRGLGASPGLDYFPLRKSTTALHRPPRPIMRPVFARWERRIPSFFREKFMESLEYYRQKDLR